MKYEKAAFDEAASRASAADGVHSRGNGAGDGNRSTVHAPPQHFDLKGTWSGQRYSMSDTCVAVYQKATLRDLPAW